MKAEKLRKIRKDYFSYEDIAKVLNIDLNSARVSASRYVKQGVLIRIKRNLYVLKEKWPNLSLEEKFSLANIIHVPSYISLMTALSYYEITTQIQRNFIESIVINYAKELSIEDVIFSYTKINKHLYFDFLKINNFFIASPEKAFVDSMYLMSIGRYSFDLTSIDFNKLDKRKINILVKKYPLNLKKKVEKWIS